MKTAMSAEELNKTLSTNNVSKWLKKLPTGAVVVRNGFEANYATPQLIETITTFSSEDLLKDFCSMIESARAHGTQRKENKVRRAGYESQILGESTIVSLDSINVTITITPVDPKAKKNSNNDFIITVNGKQYILWVADAAHRISALMNCISQGYVLPLTIQLYLAGAEQNYTNVRHFAAQFDRGLNARTGNDFLYTNIPDITPEEIPIYKAVNNGIRNIMSGIPEWDIKKFGITDPHFGQIKVLVDETLVYILKNEMPLVKWFKKMFPKGEKPPKGDNLSHDDLERKQRIVSSKKLMPYGIATFACLAFKAEPKIATEIFNCFLMGNFPSGNDGYTYLRALREDLFQGNIILTGCEGQLSSYQRILHAYLVARDYKKQGDPLPEYNPKTYYKFCTGLTPARNEKNVKVRHNGIACDVEIKNIRST